MMAQNVKESRKALGAIIITVYNKEKYIEDSLQSALMQEGEFPYKIILSDDISTDSSASVCSRYTSLYPDKIVFLPSSEHVGLVANGYKCLRYALSIGATHILQLDCDDILCSSDYFSRQIRFLEENPKYQAVFSSYHTINENAALESELKRSAELEYNYAPSGVNTRKLIAENLKMASGAAVYKTEHLEGFFREFATDENVAKFKTQDLPLWLYLSLKGEFAVCSADILGFRDLSESASRSANIAKVEAFTRNSKEIREMFAEIFFKEKGENLKEEAAALYCKKMLRHYAKLSPGEYWKYLRSVLKEKGIRKIIFSKDFIRSLAVYLKNSKS